MISKEGSRLRLHPKFWSNIEKAIVPQFLVFLYRLQEPSNFATRQFVTTKNFCIDYTQTKKIFDQLQTFGVSFKPQI